MEHQTKRLRNALRSILIRPYQKWKKWRLKVLTRRSLLRMNDERLRDIGLTRDDIDRF
ncbi:MULTISPECIES: DUF1127 domain-containing protein [unclassified Brenneria]|uniref:DUF1127 domain-containing protein n=1 Tax=unclassified Brenneria TaxID=2634434 RepID=UPI0029C303A6|nr:MULTISPECIES: DUF1127 domain-containing protein [unclassified Brenneria]MDX5630894.1 DUF1127 domain-containing protein [Brenneria sp. L3-3Z]MDX5697976.1 DUF1127 domain-containing protein [Brenneria sp. L4-2C]